MLKCDKIGVGKTNALKKMIGISDIYSSSGLNLVSYKRSVI
jgi:hypothetical protein